MTESSPSKKSAVDGRNERRLRSKATVIAATYSLIYEEHSMPAAQQVAARANVSLRLVYDLFNDMDSLISAVAMQQTERILPFLKLPNLSAPFPLRTAHFIEQRGKLYEEITPFRHAALERQRLHPRVGELLGHIQQFKREQTCLVFAPELKRITSPEEHQETRSALEAITSFSAWDAFRCQQRLSVERSQSAILRIVHSLLAAYHE